MEANEIQTLETLAKNLTLLATNGTVTATEAKIKSMQVEKDIKVIKNQYDDIINDLIAERAEAIGEPLTQLCADAILGKSKNIKQRTKK